jgi:outer membrane protein assembly factor BamD
LLIETGVVYLQALKMGNYAGMKIRGTGRLIMFLALIGCLSCSQFRKIEKSEDWRVKYEAGLNYYNKKDYYRTAVLFEQIQAIVRGLPEGEKVEFYLAYCQYYEKTYLLASNQFKVFYETYGRSSLRDEAQFMYAYSLFIASPDSNLDQKSSIEAMNAMQNFLNMHPDSPFRDKANEVVNVCHKKLEFKAYENAKQYMKLRYYQAAVISFDNFKKNYPDSGFLEELAFLKVQAIYKLALVSIPSKQMERYTAAVDYYKELVDNFPNSTYIKDAEAYYSDSLSKINTLKTQPNSNI